MGMEGSAALGVSGEWAERSHLSPGHCCGCILSSLPHSRSKD
jgi:hypothetical protein